MSRIVYKDLHSGKQAIEILYEDDNVLVVDKPPHLPVIPDRFGTFGFNLRDLLNRYLSSTGRSTKIWVVHRIDADTSGLVLFAKTEESHNSLNTLFEERKIDKFYLAIVQGNINPPQGVIDQPILKTSRNCIIHDKGKPSQTEYETIEVYEGYSLIRLKPLTGRTHQIRVHLKFIGHPLVVDPVYGRRGEISLSSFKPGYHLKNEGAQRFLCSRLTLHAQQLAYSEPVTGKEMKFDAPLPKDLLAVLKALRKYRSSVYKDQ